MKGILWVLILLLTVVVVSAQIVVVPPATLVEWTDPNPEGTMNDYPMYCMNETPVIQDEVNRVAIILAPNVQWTLMFQQGHWYCAVSGRFDLGETGLSNEIDFAVAQNMQNLHIIVSTSD